jgi:hypothetical protein
MHQTTTTIKIEEQQIREIGNSIPHLEQSGFIESYQRLGYTLGKGMCPLFLARKHYLSIHYLIRGYKARKGKKKPT